MSCCIIGREKEIYINDYNIFWMCARVILHELDQMAHPKHQSPYETELKYNSKKEKLSRKSNPRNIWRGDTNGKLQIMYQVSAVRVRKYESTI